MLLNFGREKDNLYGVGVVGLKGCALFIQD